MSSVVKTTQTSESHQVSHEEVGEGWFVQNGGIMFFSVKTDSFSQYTLGDNPDILQ